MGRPPANRPPESQPESQPQAIPLQPQQTKLEVRSGETVTVACKLPHGLVLRLFDMEESMEALQGGGHKTVQKARELPEVVILNGYLSDIRGITIQLPSRKPAFAFTPNVSKEFMERWLKENKDHDAVVGNLIKIHKSDTAGAAREYASVRTGFEPIDPSALQGNSSKPGTVKTYEKDL